MIPSVLTSQLRRGIEDYLRTTFQISTPLFHSIVDDLLKTEKGVFQGPFLSVALPFRTSDMTTDFFSSLTIPFTPHKHQEKAFRRVSGSDAQSTIVATGTGSGKTECFLYPILEYCYKNRNVQGIKAIIVYPMNALATDQAKRFAKEIHKNPLLRTTITTGLYVGQRGDGVKKASKVMTDDWVIDNHETLRRMPPDILLTNYKMLDYMLVRARDAALWQLNGPETLKYIVVDELHTFDGAQGTDLACLIRRLKHRLKTPVQHLCCIGTSATLGGSASIDKLTHYAEQIFAEKFPPESIITEDRKNPGEFLGNSPIWEVDIPEPDALEKLDPDNYTTYQEYISAQHELWFEKPIEMDEFATMDWRDALRGKLLSHLFFQNLIRVLGGKVQRTSEIIEQLRKVSRSLNQHDHYRILVLNSLLALISEAKRIPETPDDPVLPFLDVRLQLWVRELSRMVSTCSNHPQLYFSDDLKDDQLNSCLPLINCRDCGATGWLGILRKNDDEIRTVLKEVYRLYFSYDQKSIQLYPYDGDSDHLPVKGKIFRFCGTCLHLFESDTATECPWCSSTDIVRIFRPDHRMRGNKPVSEHICPFCAGTNTLAILGSRAASITSVAVSQLFASTFNDDKKLLAFSDSVQDASHRAGFFSARTYRFNLRGALQKYIDAEGAGKSIAKIADGFSRYWQQEIGIEKYLASFTPPDLSWLEDFEHLTEHGKLPAGSDLLELINRRIHWEILSEYTFNARIGRTLEKTGCSVANVVPDAFNAAVDTLLPILQNEIGDLRSLKRVDLEHFIFGIIVNLKNQGGINHPTIGAYIHSFGNAFLLGRHLRKQYPFMPTFSIRSRTPRFLTTNPLGRFELLESSDQQRTTWHTAWGVRNFVDYSILIKSVMPDIYRIVLEELVKRDILEIRNEKDHSIWGLSPSSLRVSNTVELLRCTKCGHSLSVAEIESDHVQGMPCMRISCGGSFQRDSFGRDYYASLYKKGNVQRIFAEEHTGLLSNEVRSTIEQQFKNPSGNPCAPNLLSCTPTLEMGINIGDLSSAVLCSVPPRQANYLQRIGRIGRTDGNGMSVTIAGGKPHDLYFFAEPEEMIAGEVDPPGVFLRAPAVLKRQLIAFCFDTWIASGSNAASIPTRINDVLNSIENGNPVAFPSNVISFILSRQNELFDQFISFFSEHLQPNDIETLRTFFFGNEEAEGSLTFGVMESIQFLLKQRAGFKKKISTLNKQLAKLRSDPARDNTYEEKEQQLQVEKSALASLIKSINDRDTYGWLTDEGILPNYAFPESGVTLRSVIYRRKKEPDADGSNWQTWAYEFERPAVAAIKELAPENSFYAAHRKVEIDQVDLTLSTIETWRFCNNCSFMRKVIGEEADKSCPECGSQMWSDKGQKKNMIKLKQVFATSEDSSSRIGDDIEERDPVFYNRQLLVNFHEKDIAEAFRLDCPDLPFGFEFIKKATLREVNFGRMGTGGDSLTIAGSEMERKGFTVCRSCGKIQKDDHRIEHAYSCPNRNKENSADDLMQLLYLYREYTSEAIRILLPTTTFSDSDTLLHSFIAALQLGLKMQFGGDVEHLQTCLNEEPIPDSTYRKRYLVLYDTVPGGTGYLHQLMISHEKMVDVLKKALTILENCTCRHEPEKDGCYRCLYAYRNSFDMRSISRTKAVELLSEIIKNEHKFLKIDCLKNVTVNSLFDSELEQRFVDALRSSKRPDRQVMIKADLVNRKKGYFLKVKDTPWIIEPQVTLGENDGVTVPVSVDFVFWPARDATHNKPIAVFTDGFTYHKDRIGIDTAQRMAILESGKFDVWSFSWHDITTTSTLKNEWYIDYLPHKTTTNDQELMKYLDHFLDEDNLSTPVMRTLHQKDSFSLFLQYLGTPDRSLWEKYAFVTGLLYKKPGPDLTNYDLVKSFLSQLPLTLSDKVIPEKQTHITGYYQTAPEFEPDPTITLLCNIEKSSVTSGWVETLTFIVSIDDTRSSEVNFEQKWNGFLRIANIIQFLPNCNFLSIRGLQGNLYSSLSFARQIPSASTTPGISPDDLWQDAFDYTSAEALPVLEIVKSKGIKAPTVGFELTSNNGQVIATAEIVWEAEKVALLLSHEHAYVTLFDTNGWKTSSIKDSTACLTLIESIF